MVLVVCSASGDDVSDGSASGDDASDGSASGVGC